MNERMKKIMDFERQLLQSRMQLQHLIEESDIVDDELMKTKVANFEREISYMEGQLAGLKKYIEANDGKVPESPVMVELSEPVDLTEKVLAREAMAATQKNQSQVQSVEKPQIQQEPASQGVIKQAVEKAKQPLPKKDLEKTVGKSLMGIVASVLIFISIVLFANLILPYFNDFAKMTCMYLVSFGFLAIGLAKMNKDAHNKFYVALTGCGVGAIYISLLMSNMYFEIITDIPLFVLIAIWAVGVCFLAKHRNKVFHIIGRIGVTISVIVGCVGSVNADGAGKFIVLIIFYLVAAGVFYVTHYEQEYADNLISHIFGTIDMIVFAMFVSLMDDYMVPTIMLIVIATAYIGVALYGSVKRSSIVFGICVSIKTFIVIALIYNLGLSDLMQGIIGFLLSMAVMIAVDFKECKDTLGKHILTCVMVWLAFCALDMNNCREFLVVPLLTVPLLGYGFWRSNEVMKFAGIIVFAIDEMTKVSTEGYLFLVVLVFALGFLLIYRNREQYNKYFKWFLHIMATLMLMGAVEDFVHFLTEDWDVAQIVSFLAVVLFNVGMFKSSFGTNLATGEREKGIVYNIINAICMLVGLVFIGYHNDMGIWHMLIIVATLAAFMVNAKNILDKRDNMIAGIYVGIKFLVLMVVILESFESANYVVSIACFVMAIVSIVIGFVGEYKSLRIFGLVLSMISTFKLIMVDISYADSLGNALSFFASGVLCFVISLIYNYIDGKMQKKE